MIGDRHVFVVRQQRIVGAKRAAGIGGVKDRSIKIGEVADRDRQQQFGRAIGDKCRRRLCRHASALKARDKESRKADQACGPSAISVLRFGAAHAFAAAAASPAKDADAAATSRICVADRHADARICARARAETRRTAGSGSGNRCPRAFAALDKASPRGIVCLVQGRGHGTMVDSKSSPLQPLVPAKAGTQRQPRISTWIPLARE